MSTNLELVHHLADPAPLLPDDVAVEVERHFYLGGDRDQGLRHTIELHVIPDAQNLSRYESPW